jgi:hypothetical protein
MDTRRRIDLCTCGKPREDGVHMEEGAMTHLFMPNPQPPPVPVATDLTRISATRSGGTWAAIVQSDRDTGYGQAAAWIDAVNAAIEDLKEKQS